ncbi:hypothetical protein [Streptomyces sp. S.PB5]|uniref:hypothetical protein n=1 Tax=Streptomyces sp. S.PB5 TaxID=3020844 RepID=UPI0025AFC79A|nr:hypothetical protein [Streptomyces sp. S.PB5]MDN3029355.1 hypothetical protein [Streptomyces sp. S.PB5]
MSTAVWSPVSPAVVSAGIGHPRPARRLADRAAEAVCRSLAAGGARAEVEAVELHRLAADLAHVIHRRRTDVHADPMPTVVVADPADSQPTAQSDAGRLHARIDLAGAELAAAMRSHRQ